MARIIDVSGLGSADDMIKHYPTLQSMLTSDVAQDDYDQSVEHFSHHHHHHHHHHSHHDDTRAESGDFTGLSVSPTSLNHSSDGYIDEFTGVIKKPDSSSIDRLNSIILPTTSTDTMTILDKHLRSMHDIWKDVPHTSPYHRQRSNILIVVKKHNVKDEDDSTIIKDEISVIEEEAALVEEETTDEEAPFDYSIFLNKPSSPCVERVESEDTSPVEEEKDEILVNEGVIEREEITEENVDEILSESQVFFGNVCPKPLVSVLKTDNDVYRCDLCSMTFNRKGNYNRHRMTHFVKSKSAAFRYKCEVCGRNFLQKCDLTRHMHIHDNTQPYRCSICGKGYIRKKDLEVHTRFHTGEKAFLCVVCKKSYYSKGDLNRHERSAHSNESKLMCGHCTRRFSREATLLQHMQTKHNEVILLALKDQVCKLQPMPSVVEVDTIPYQVDKVTSTVVMRTTSSSSDGGGQSSLATSSSDDDVTVMSLNGVSCGDDASLNDVT